MAEDEDQDAHLTDADGRRRLVEEYGAEEAADVLRTADEFGIDLSRPERSAPAPAVVRRPTWTPSVAPRPPPLPPPVPEPTLGERLDAALNGWLMVVALVTFWGTIGLGILGAVLGWSPDHHPLLAVPFLLSLVVLAVDVFRNEEGGGDEGGWIERGGGPPGL